MTEAQKRFIELERRKEDIKRYFDELSEATEAVSKEIGLNTMFQDDQGIVYRIVVPEGRFVHFDKYSYERTKRVGERAGTLSMKEAEAAGFKINRD